MSSGLQAQRIALLANKGETIFHIKDLATLWNIREPKTLRMTLKRYADAGLLHRIYRGFYATLPLEDLSAEELGAKALHAYTYLSTETVLFQQGYMSQKPQAITFISSNHKIFNIGGRAYLSRQLKKAFLYSPEGLQEQNGIKIASVERAIADLLYFNPLASFDKKVNWSAVRSLQKKIGYTLTPTRYVASKTQ